MKRHHVFIFLEFFFVGLLLGIIEDLIAIKLSTDAEITFTTIGIAAFVALPFAIFSELIIDQSRIKRILKRQKEKFFKEFGKDKAS
jgi:hypothetical protein